MLWFLIHAAALLTLHAACSLVYFALIFIGNTLHSSSIHLDTPNSFFFCLFGFEFYHTHLGTDLRPVLGCRLEFCTLYCLWYKHLLWIKKACWFNFSFTILFPSNFALEIWIGILEFLSFRTPLPTKTALGIQQFLGIRETREFQILNRSTSWHVCWSACQVSRVTSVLLSV